MSDGVKLMMTLPASNKYYAVNDRTTNLLIKGKIDTNAATGDVDAPKFSDAAISGLWEQETEVLITVTKKDDTKTRPGGAFFP